VSAVAVFKQTAEAVTRFYAHSALNDGRKIRAKSDNQTELEVSR
jgi:hypothetical protein